ncbi:TetR family transcriptional regulator [Nonomuraea sp. NPDC003560]|uniref:TetR family transcriptional regulator n=1 Tax=Nonomuraea sp. NPDC003560 TaxID=3364341 RepID=UPI0036C8CEC1
MTVDVRSDETLVAEFLAGEKDAFAVLYARYAAPVEGYIYKRKAQSAREDLNELVQEVFAEALALLDTFCEGDYDGAHPFRQWLFNIPAGNVLFQDRKRHWAEQERYLKSADDLAFRLRTDFVSAPTDVQLSDKMRGTLDALRPHYRQAIELHILEGQWLMTAASIMGRDESSVRYLVRAGLEKLRKPFMPQVAFGDGKGALIEAARRLIAEHGVDRVSARKIALAAGCDPSLVRHHFGTKQALLDAALNGTDLAVAS